MRVASQVKRGQEERLPPEMIREVLKGPSCAEATPRAACPGEDLGPALLSYAWLRPEPCCLAAGSSLSCLQSEQGRSGVVR